MHDLGFMYSLYAVALYRITGDVNMKQLGIQAADQLAKRYNPAGGYIQAWGRMDSVVPTYVDEELAQNWFFTQSKGLAIIDCMMNIPLLFWATEATGHPFYAKVAMAHADTTLKYFIRQDSSVCHAYRFDEKTGVPLGAANYCGFSPDSHWARGTAWGIYGFAISYSYTGKPEYLAAAIKLADRFVELSEVDGIPVWDFRLPGDTPALYSGTKEERFSWNPGEEANKRYNRDTSAAAVTVCGILEILKHRSHNRLSAAAEQMLDSLCGKYLDDNPGVPGLLKEQNGNRTYACYGDYFLMETLAVKEYSFDRIW
jgi:unsaturated chondroitin disaccharide hydrolase